MMGSRNVVKFRDLSGWQASVTGQRVEKTDMERSKQLLSVQTREALVDVAEAELAGVNLDEHVLAAHRHLPAAVS